jgi:hypothetical protein
MSFAVQRFTIEGRWEDAGEYPNTASTTITHARECTKHYGTPYRAIVRETDQVLAAFEKVEVSPGHERHTGKVRRWKDEENTEGEDQ